MDAWKESALVTRTFILSLGPDERVALYAQSMLSPREVAVVEHYVLGRPLLDDALEEVDAGRIEAPAFLEDFSASLGVEAAEAEGVCAFSRAPMGRFGAEERAAALEASLAVAMGRIAHFGGAGIQ